MNFRKSLQFPTHCINANRRVRDPAGVLCDRYIANGSINLETLPIESLNLAQGEWAQVEGTPYEVNRNREARWIDDKKEAQVYVHIEGFLCNTYILWFDAFKKDDDWRELPSNRKYLIDPYGFGQSKKNKKILKRQFQTTRTGVNTRFDYDNYGTLPSDLSLSRWGDIVSTVKTLAVTLDIAKKRRDIQLLIEQTFIPLEHRYFYQEYKTLKIRFPHLSFEAMWEQCPKDRESLLCVAFPDLFMDYKGRKEVGDIPKMSHEQFYWQCHIHNGKPQKKRPEEVCSTHGYCDSCKPALEAQQIQGLQSIKTGQNVEEYIVELLKEIYPAETVHHSGSFDRAQEDIHVTIDGRQRCIQVKNFGKTVTKDGDITYSTPLTPKFYDDDMLMIFANPADKKFVCCYYKRINDKERFGLRFTNLAKARRDTSWEHETKEGLMNAIRKLLPEAICADEIANRYGETIKKEVGMRGRLFAELDKRNIPFDARDSGGAIDCHINGKTIQLKFTSEFKPKLDRYGFKLYSRKGAYSVDDGLDFFIIEGGLHLGQFLISPIQELIDSGNITVGDKLGKQHFTFPKPEDKADILHRYWNNFDQLL